MFLELIQRLSAQVPSQCAVCHAWPSRPVCDACVAAFAQPIARCRTCARPVLETMSQCGQCVSHPPALDQCLAAVPYAYPWSGLITEFKFREHTAWAGTFATLMRSAPWVEPALEQADLVVPLPLSAQRLRERGFNQTLLLARALAPSRLADKVLLRILDTVPQSSLPRRERLTSLEHAYTLDPLRSPSLAGKRVLLVDDVMTTGATLNAAAQCFRQAGAFHITGLVLARTE